MDSPCVICGCVTAGTPIVTIDAMVSFSGRTRCPVRLAVYHLPCVMDVLVNGDVHVGSMLEALDRSGIIRTTPRLQVVR